MAVTIPIKEPEVLTAGDTWTWIRTLPDFPANAGWELTYYFAGADAIEITAIAEGEAHRVVVDVDETKDFPAGIYYGFGRVSNGTETYTIWRGTLNVKPDPASLAEGYDGRSNARIVLDKINLRLEGRLDSDVVNFTISDGGMTRALGKIPIPELLKLKSYYESLVAQEEAEERIAQGVGNRNKVKVRFSGV